MTNKRRLIGLLGHKHSGTYNPGYGQNAAYVEFFRQYGDVIIIDAQCETVIPVDLLVLPGGRDVLPMRYGQKPKMATQVPDVEYEWFFTFMFQNYLQRAIENKTAIYGICAGFQNLIVEFDGELTQHMSQLQSTDWRGELVDKLEFNHKVINQFEGLKNSYASFKNNVNYYKTNSIHHQGVFEDQITDDFLVVATNKNFDNIEFIIHKDFPIAGEQSHPEERTNPLLTFSLIDQILENINNE